MKSLQVLTPARKCIFNCPFCISKSHEHSNEFVDNYSTNYDLWERNFIKVLTDYEDLENIVITGTNEPMQDTLCVDKIIDLTRKYRIDINIELQTRYYIKHYIYNKLDVVAYSISDFKYLDKITPSNVINRYVIILTDSFNNKHLSDIINNIPNTVAQITFKKLQDSNGSNIELDNWIKEHKTEDKTVNNLIYDIENYKGNLSIRYDGDCMNSENRYMIFREDGNLYNDWNSKEGLI